MGLFKKFANALKKTREAFARKFDAILSHGQLDDDFYDELTDILISCDIGVKTSMEIVDELRLYARKNKIRTSDEVKSALKSILTTQLENAPKIEFRENKKFVQVISHPMAMEHYIQFIEVYKKDKSELHLKYFKPNDVPEFDISYTDDDIEAVEHCNIHGLWGEDKND